MGLPAPPEWVVPKEWLHGPSLSSSPSQRTCCCQGGGGLRGACIVHLMTRDMEPKPWRPEGRRGVLLLHWW